MNISYDQISESMFFVEGPTLTIESRSIGDPRIIIENSVTEDKDLFEDSSSDSVDDEESVIIEFFRVWQTVIISMIVILFGSIGVVKAIQYRLEQDRKRFGLPQEEDTETAGEWMSKFIKKSKPKIFVESEIIDVEDFESDFKSKSGKKEANPTVVPSKFDIKVASKSLDKAMTEDALDDIVELADNISEEKGMHPKNSELINDDFESRFSKLNKGKNK